MKPYVIQQGDHLSKLAFCLGFDAEEVWLHPDNADLRGRRAPNLLHPGDVLRIPEAAAPGLQLSAGTLNRYQVNVPTRHVTLVFTRADSPVANEPCTIGGLGALRETKTEADGSLTVVIPVNTREFTLTFTRMRRTHRVFVGDMDPVDETSGVVKRLAHLGYYHPGVDDDAAEALVAALMSFQTALGLPPTGVIDEETKQALLLTHRS